jgi:hypothetical protein
MIRRKLASAFCLPSPAGAGVLRLIKTEYHRKQIGERRKAAFRLGRRELGSVNHEANSIE